MASILVSTAVLADDSQKFCLFLLERAKQDPATKLHAKDTRAKLDELMEISKLADDFLSLAKSGIEKKMSWPTFQKFAKSQGTNLSDYYQPQYDKMYVDKYCGKAKTEANIKVNNGVVKTLSEKSFFELKPEPNDHEYGKQYKSAQ